MLLKSAKLTKSQKENAIEKIFDESAPKYDFFLMLILSSLIVTLGLLMDSAAVVIGGMLIAPILSPIVSFSMGMVVGNYKMMKRSGLIIAQSILIVLIIAFATAALSIDLEATQEIISRTHPSLAYLLVDIFSGIAVSYALVRPALSEILPGVAISVALLPPLAVLGISLSRFDSSGIIGSLQLFFVNLLGIIFASLAVFSVLKFYEVKEVVEKKIKGEEKIAEKERREREMQKIEEIEKKVMEVAEILHERKK